MTEWPERTTKSGSTTTFRVVALFLELRDPKRIVSAVLSPAQGIWAGPGHREWLWRTEKLESLSGGLFFGFGGQGAICLGSLVFGGR